MIHLLIFAAWDSYIATWIVDGLTGRRTWLHSLLIEIRWPALVVCIVDHAFLFMDTHSVFLRAWEVVTCLVWCWVVMSNKDDRWKRRRRRALARVKQIRGKLVVVPVPSPAGA